MPNRVAVILAAVEVQVMLALLRCIDNPEQDLAMAAVLRSPLVGLDETALAGVRLAGDGHAVAEPAGLCCFAARQA